MKTITVEIRNVYGNNLIYPICDNAKLFAELTRKKTIDKSDVDKIKALGYEIIFKAKTI